MASKKVTIDYDEAVNFLAGMFPTLSVHIIERALDENGKKVKNYKII